MTASDAAEPAGEPTPCPPCRGTGTVISNLGGTRSEVPCPWCDGTGVLNPAADAQAHWRAEVEGGAERTSQEAGRTSDPPAA